jgi:hypothetical protein
LYQNLEGCQFTGNNHIEPITLRLAERRCCAANVYEIRATANRFAVHFDVYLVLSIELRCVCHIMFPVAEVDNVGIDYLCQWM